MIREIEFGSRISKFQQELDTVIKEQKRDQNILREADKTDNFYPVPVEKDKKLLKLDSINLSCTRWTSWEKGRRKKTEEIFKKNFGFIVLRLCKCR